MTASLLTHYHAYDVRRASNRFVTAEWFTDHGPYDKLTWDGFTLAQLVALIIFTFAGMVLLFFSPVNMNNRSNVTRVFLIAPMAFTFLFIAWQQTIRHAAEISRYE